MLCRGKTLFKRLEDIPKVFVCLCLQGADHLGETHKVCSTCNRGSYWVKTSIMKRFSCPFCEASKSNSGKFQIKIMPTPDNPTVHRPTASINLHSLYLKKKDKEEAKRRAERVELADLIAEKLSQKIQPEIIAHEMNDK